MKGALLLAWLLAISSPAFAQTLSLQARDDKFTARVVLNDQLQALALVDLGATSVVVCDQMALTLGLPRGEDVVLETVGKRLPAQRTRVSSIRLGPIVLRDVRALILGDDWCEEVLLGFSYLRHLQVVLRGDTLTLRRERAKRVGRIRKYLCGRRKL